MRRVLLRVSACRDADWSLQSDGVPDSRIQVELGTIELTLATGKLNWAASPGELDSIAQHEAIGLTPAHHGDGLLTYVSNATVRIPEFTEHFEALDTDEIATTTIEVSLELPDHSRLGTRFALFGGPAEHQGSWSQGVQRSYARGYHFLPTGNLSEKTHTLQRSFGALELWVSAPDDAPRLLRKYSSVIDRCHGDDLSAVSGMSDVTWSDSKSAALVDSAFQIVVDQVLHVPDGIVITHVMGQLGKTVSAGDTPVWTKIGDPVIGVSRLESLVSTPAFDCKADYPPGTFSTTSADEATLVMDVFGIVSEYLCPPTETVPVLVGKVSFPVFYESSSGMKLNIGKHRCQVMLPSGAKTLRGTTLLLRVGLRGSEIMLGKSGKQYQVVPDEYSIAATGVLLLKHVMVTRHRLARTAPTVEEALLQLNKRLRFTVAPTEWLTDVSQQLIDIPVPVSSLRHDKIDRYFPVQTPTRPTRPTAPSALCGTLQLVVHFASHPGSVASAASEVCMRTAVRPGSAPEQRC